MVLRILLPCLLVIFLFPAEAQTELLYAEGEATLGIGQADPIGDAATGLAIPFDVTLQASIDCLPGRGGPEPLRVQASVEQVVGAPEEQPEEGDAEAQEDAEPGSEGGEAGGSEGDEEGDAPEAGENVTADENATDEEAITPPAPRLFPHQAAVPWDQYALSPDSYHVRGSLEFLLLLPTGTSPGVYEVSWMAGAVGSGCGLTSHWVTGQPASDLVVVEAPAPEVAVQEQEEAPPASLALLVGLLAAVAVVRRR